MSIVQSNNKVIAFPFSGMNHDLKGVSRHFPKQSKLSEMAKESLKILKKIEYILQKEKQNQDRLEILKKELLYGLRSIQQELETPQHLDHSDVKKILKNIKNYAENNSSFKEKHQFHLSDQEAKSTGTQYLHSIGLDRIVNMINSASVQEPEWMARTGVLLVVDNNPNTVQVLERRLTKEGHQVLTAEDEDQALSYLQSHAVETILVDYLLFKDNLRSFLKKVETYARTGYIPLIVMGVSENMQGMERIVETGGGDFLTKPVNPILLKARVRAGLERKYAFDQRVKRLEEMQRTRQELQVAIQDLPDGFAIFDQNNQLVTQNDKLFEFYPHLKSRETMIRGGLTFEKLLESNVAAGIYPLNSKGQLSSRQWLEEKKANFLLPASQWEETLTNGLTLSVTTYRTPDGGGALVVKDVSQDKAHHQDLTFLAYHDALTGLPNRKAFYQRLDQAMLNMSVSAKSILAVLFLDLDGFKAINDTYGHEMGDWILNQVSQRLRGCVRGGDTVARFGGDEFCVILNQVSTRRKVKMVASRMLKSVAEPYIRNDVSMKLGVSIGIGIYTPKIQDGEALLKEADIAMYAVKQQGKGQFLFFDEMAG